MFTNFRLIHHVNDAGEVYFQIQQVIYDDEGKPLRCADALPPSSHEVEALKNQLINQISALTLPVLDSKIFKEDKVEE